MSHLSRARLSFRWSSKRKFATVKIYEVRNRERKNFTVSYVSTAGRVRKTFASLELATKEAQIIVDNLAAGDLEALKLTGGDKQIYVEAKQAIARTGIPLGSAAQEFARAFDILGHAGIVEAARYYKKHVETGLPEVPVCDAVARYAKAKQAQGMSRPYLKDIRGLLGRFATHFQCNIATIMPEDLRAYLNGLKVGMVAKNNHRRLIVGLFSFARAEGWLRPNEETAAQRLGTYKVKPRDVEIFTPAEVARLLAHASEDFLPWVALIAFGGLRNEELHKGLMWESINFDRVAISSFLSRSRKRSAKGKSSCPKICYNGLPLIGTGAARFSIAIFGSLWLRCAKRPG